MGTVVDVDGSVHRETTAALTSAGIRADDIERVLALSADRLGSLMDDVSARRRPWQAHRALRVAAVTDTLASLGLPALSRELETTIAGITNRLTAWPDSVAGLDRLRGSFLTAALSNADTAELAAMSASAGLSWHAAISAEHAKAFKPDPAVYRLALHLLDVPAEQTLMVAAHPWDLRAAAAHGLATAFVNRPGADQPDTPDEFDLIASDLDHLADQLDL